MDKPSDAIKNSNNYLYNKSKFKNINEINNSKSYNKA